MFSYTLDLFPNYGVQSLVQSLCWAHGALNVKRANVLPMFLEKRYQKVDSQVNVVNQFIFGHSSVANSNIEAQYLKDNYELIYLDSY